MKLSEKIVAIIVTYHPEISSVKTLLDTLGDQVAQIIVVDNGSGQQVSEFFSNRIRSNENLISLLTNKGIAAAQNVGIDYARKTGASHIILFDQDSSPSPDMVSELIKVWRHQTEIGKRVASVGPRYFDARQNYPPPFIQVRGLKVLRQPCPCPDSVAEVDYLIASGCLIPMAAIDQVGGMREELFIDYVDIEWGLRAKSKGFQSYGACGALMEHDLGDAPIRFFDKNIPVHSPLRHYYHFRNALWMYRQDWLPLHWKLADGWRLLLKYGFYSLFARPRWSHIKMMSRGILHGMLNRMGPLNIHK